MTTWTVETVRALAKELDERVDGQLQIKAASALTWALERMKGYQKDLDDLRGDYADYLKEFGVSSVRECGERMQKAEAERDAANARAEEAAACMQVLVSCARPYLQDGHQHQNREYLLHALDDSVRMIATLRALKEAGK